MKQYLVKKDVNKPNSEDNWIIMTGRQFCRFLETEDGQRRKKNFATLEGDDEAPTIVIECDNEHVKAFDAERKREKYRREVRSCYKHIGFECVTRPEGTLTYAEVVPSEAPSPEEILISKFEKELLYEAIEMLTQNEKEMTVASFLTKNPLSVKEYAALKGIAEPTACITKMRALKKLKIYLENLGYQG